MRNPRFFDFVKKVFGIRPQVVSVGSFRRSRICAGALQEAAKKRLGAADLEDALLDMLAENSVEALGMAALRGGDLMRAIRKATRALKPRLPIGSVRTTADLEEVLVEYGHELRSAKARERRELEGLLARYAAKRAEADSRHVLRDRVIREAAERANRDPRNKDNLDKAYDEAHGPYAVIPCYTAFRRDVCDWKTLAEAIREQHLKENHREGNAAEPEKGASSNTVTVLEAGTLVLLEGWVPGESWRQFYSSVPPALRINIPAPFDKEGWTYFLQEEPGETDRHCSTPATLEEISDLMDEDEDHQFLRDLVLAWAGSPSAIARAFQVRPETVAPYLFQFDPLGLEKVWKKPAHFCALKAFEEDRYSLASPWSMLDFLGRLGGGNEIYEPIERVKLRFERVG